MRALRGLKKFWVMIVTLGVVVFGGLSHIQNAWAEGEREYWIQVTPTNLDLGDLKAGKTKEAQFQIVNDGTKEFGYELKAGPYAVEGENYDPKYDTESEHTDIYKWIVFDEYSGRVAPGERKVVNVTVKVPENAPAGGQYAVMWARMIKERQDATSTGVTPIEEVGVVTYANIDGVTARDGSILENKVPSFMFAPPIQTTSVVENKSNVHARAQYIMQVYPLFGGEEVYTNEETPDTKIILPETKRVNTLTWDGSPQLGIFKVKQTVKFLGEENVTEKVVFICPIWFLFIVLVLIFLIVFWIVSRARGRKE